MKAENILGLNKMIIKYFNELTRSLPEACFLVSRTSEIVAVNPSGERMLETDGKLLAGKRITDLVTDPDDQVSRYLQICLRNREAVPGSLRWRSREGRTIECRCHGHLILSDTEEDKNLVLLRCEPREAVSNGFIALNKTLEELRTSHHILIAQSEVLKNEVIERRQAEGALRESQARLLTILDSMEAIVYVADMKTYEVIFVNKYVRDLFGEIEGKICWQAIQSGQTGPCDFCTNNKIVDPGGNPASPYVWEFRNTKTDRWYYIVDRALSWVDGRIVRLEIATDITERKQAEMALLKSEERLRRFSSVSSEGLFFHDGGRVVDANPAILSLMGYSNLQEVIGMSVFDVILPEYHELAKQKIQMSVVEPHEIQLRRKDGTVFPAEITAREYEFQGRPFRAVSVRDITERKRAEEELRQYRERLEELVKERTTELDEKNRELEHFNKLFVGRELRMVELKERIRELEMKSGGKGDQDARQ